LPAKDAKASPWRWCAQKRTSEETIMRRLWMMLVSAGLLAGATTTDAALWSLSNEVLVPPYGSVDPVLSFTGDETTIAAQVDVVVPSYLGVANVRPLNGGYCHILRDGTRTLVRALLFDPLNRPLASAPTPICQFSISAPGPVPSAFFEYAYPLCVDALLTGGPCQLDRGYLTVTTGLPHW
jgi:hypothetical protein